MDVAKIQYQAQESRPIVRRSSMPHRRALTAGIVAVMVAASLATALVVVPRVTQNAQTPASIAAANSRPVDRLLAPAAIDFRRGERADAGTARDPLLAPAAIDFRRGEQAYPAVTGDRLQAPNVIDFRRGEHSDAGTTTDPLLSPNNIEFRRGER